MESTEYTKDSNYLMEKSALVHLFPRLSFNDAEYLIQNSRICHFSAGTIICKEGEYGTTSFAVLNGAVEVSINTDLYENLTLSVLGQGNIFGEMAALSGYPRTATVTAKEETTVLELSADVLKHLMNNSPAFKENIYSLYAQRAVQSYLRKVPFFMNLQDSTLKQIEKIVDLNVYNRGDIIFSEGEVGDSLYIIRTGFVKVTKRHYGKEQIIAYLAHGNYFGEMALIENESRNATVSAFTKSEVIRISKDNFDTLLEANSDFSEHIKDTVLERKLKTLEVQKDQSRAERLETIVEKGIIQAQSLLIIDLKSCIHCDNCVKSCEDRHGYPRLDRRGTRIAEISVPVACRLCHDPLCLVCNFDAIKRAPTGEIYVIDDKCIGVSGCAIRCPYNVIKMVSTKSKSEPNLFNILGKLMETGKENKEDRDNSKDQKVKPKRLAIKCDNCLGYSDTACTNNCPTHSIKWVNPVEHFGDDEDIINKKHKYQL